MNVIDEVVSRRFLLGDVSAEEQERIQELAFADPDTFALIEAAQEDLIDDFVNDELSSEEKERFQNYFLVQPGRRENVRIARALQQYWSREGETVADSRPMPRPGPSIFDWIRLRYATVALALLIITVAAVLLAVYLSGRKSAPPVEVRTFPTPSPATPDVSPGLTPTQPTPSPTQTINQSSPTPAPRQSVESVYAVVLVPGGPARSEGEETKVRPVSAPVTFELPLVDDTSFQSYRAVLQNNGKRLLSWSNLQPKELRTGKGIAIVVPAGLLQNLKHYRITLSGISAEKSQVVDSYYFVVSH